MPRGSNPSQALLSRAASVALSGGMPAVRSFMQAHGHPMSGAWCGEFAASVLQSQGLQAPRNPEVASNWRGWGSSDIGPRPGDVAVRIGRAGQPGSQVPTGEEGSHVTFVGNARGGQFQGVGGNQGSLSPQWYPSSQYQFFRPSSSGSAAGAVGNAAQSGALPYGSQPVSEQTQPTPVSETTASMGTDPGFTAQMGYMPPSEGSSMNLFDPQGVGTAYGNVMGSMGYDVNQPFGGTNQFDPWTNNMIAGGAPGFPDIGSRIPENLPQAIPSALPGPGYQTGGSSGSSSDYSSPYPTPFAEQSPGLWTNPSGPGATPGETVSPTGIDYGNPAPNEEMLPNPVMPSSDYNPAPNENMMPTPYTPQMPSAQELGLSGQVGGGQVDPGFWLDPASLQTPLVPIQSHPYFLDRQGMWSGGGGSIGSSFGAAANVGVAPGGAGVGIPIFNRLL